MPGIATPLSNRKPGDIDFVVVRENTEGEYSSVGGRMYEGTEREIVFQESVFSRKGCDRIIRYAFELARSRPRRKVTSATKSNGIAITMPYWDERFKAIASQFADVTTDAYHIDILVALHDFEELADLLLNKLAKIRGIRSLVPAIAIDVVKYEFDVAPIEAKDG